MRVSTQDFVGIVAEEKALVYYPRIANQAGTDMFCSLVMWWEIYVRYIEIMLK